MGGTGTTAYPHRRHPIHHGARVAEWLVGWGRDRWGHSGLCAAQRVKRLFQKSKRPMS